MRFVFVMALVALLPACAVAQSKNIHEQTDPQTKLHVLSLEVPTVACAGDPPPQGRDPVVHLVFFAAERPNHGVDYMVTAVLDGGSLLHLRRNGTMDTLADGMTGTLTTPEGSSFTNLYEGRHRSLHETAVFPLDPHFIESLSRTGAFQFRLDGPRQAVQRCVETKKFRDLPEFLDASTHL